jgi:hypothetical protein
MKKIQIHLLTLFLAITVVDLDIEDVNKKVVITIHYSNKEKDVIVVEQKDLDTTTMYQELDKIIAKRQKESSQ